MRLPEASGGGERVFGGRFSVLGAAGAAGAAGTIKVGIFRNGQSTVVVPKVIPATEVDFAECLRTMARQNPVAARSSKAHSLAEWYSRSFGTFDGSDHETSS